MLIRGGHYGRLCPFTHSQWLARDRDHASTCPSISHGNRPPAWHLCCIVHVPLPMLPLSSSLTPQGLHAAYPFTILLHASGVVWIAREHWDPCVHAALPINSTRVSGSRICPVAPQHAQYLLAFGGPAMLCHGSSYPTSLLYQRKLGQPNGNGSIRTAHPRCPRVRHIYSSSLSSHSLYSAYGNLKSGFLQGVAEERFGLAMPSMHASRMLSAPMYWCGYGSSLTGSANLCATTRTSATTSLLDVERTEFQRSAPLPREVPCG